ncbi:MAG: histidine kinase [Hyphomonadaceae bacterium]
MILRLALLLLALLPTPLALAQPAAVQPPITGLLSSLACKSLGTGSDLSDIDRGSCRGFTEFNQVDTQDHIVWVIGHFTIQPGYPGHAPLGLYTGALASRDMWWNGERIGEIGRVGATPEEEIPGNLDAVTWIPPQLIHTGDNEVAVRLSTHHLAVRVAAPLHYIYAARMGDSRMLLTEYGTRLGVTGALIAAMLFFGVTFAMNRRTPGPLFLALISAFVIGQLWLESIRGFTNFLYPLQIWRLSGIGILAFGFGLALTAYVAHRFVPGLWRLHVLAAALLAIVVWPLMPGFDGMTLGFVLAPSIVCLAAALQGLVAKRAGAMLAALALAAFVALELMENIVFMDRTFYIAVTLLMLVLIVDQARVLRRAREAEELARRRASTLELELLRRRIAPHFLMNTLNALAEWVESDPKTGVKMIEALAEEFRLLSQISDRALIPLSEEIALCRRHLEVMSYRVDKPFSLTTQAIDETAEVPPGVLHTLVENAFTHGRFADGGEFRLTSERSDTGEHLVLQAPPTTIPRTPKSAPGGEGLAYVRRRLEAAFGPGAHVESSSSDNGWRTVLTIPRGMLTT